MDFSKIAHESWPLQERARAFIRVISHFEPETGATFRDWLEQWNHDMRRAEMLNMHGAVEQLNRVFDIWHVDVVQALHRLTPVFHELDLKDGWVQYVPDKSLSEHFCRACNAYTRYEDLCVVRTVHDNALLVHTSCYSILELVDPYLLDSAPSPKKGRAWYE